MTICGVVCELNPFHYGHEYLLKKAREITGADYIIAVMSGDFVQRGIPAICDKYSRCKMALLGGADLVIEIPTIYATAAADYYAFGAVSTLASLNCVDYICFGTETGNIEFLEQYISSENMQDDECSNDLLDENSLRGLSYARKMSLANGDLQANDMLATCYLRNLREIGSTIKPVAIKRIGSGYFDIELSSTSATAIRKSIIAGENITDYIPEYVNECLDDISFEYYPVSLNDFSVQLYTRIDSIINTDNSSELTDYMDVSSNLEGRIKSNFYDFVDYEEFINSVHSKNYTKSRVMRALLHIMLDIKKSDYDFDALNGSVSYIRLLGFRKESAEVLSIIKENCVVPVISKARDATKILDDEALNIFTKDIHTANLYEQACAFKYKNMPIHDFSKEIVKV